MKKFRNLDETQKFAIAIPALFILSCLIKRYLENFRGTWIYAYGSVGCIIVCFLMFFFSLANSISIIRYLKIKLLPKILWFLLSASVFLLIAGLMIAIALDIA
ncbi:hypothetical protein SAMN05444484_108141 [Flavobacterium chilense]|uniref:Uncharacterized protein n=1 Tax=Flavobacterium chilense TaxID=946677 RepID=A0A1M7KUI3_9FLAO|nr:hypothetical protein SAMN05444484_108141 [Flavobacterium chilense]